MTEDRVSKSMKLKPAPCSVSGVARFSAIVLALLLSACVTTTSGGFQSNASQERALQDYIELATGYYEADDMVGARRHIENALNIDSRSSDAYHVRALVFQREGEDELARENFERALRLDSDNSRARNNFAAFLFERGEYEAAYRHLERVTQDTAYEARPLAFQNLGLSALRSGNLERAEYAFRRALQLDANLYRSALELAQIAFERGDYSEAETYYSQFATTTEFLQLPPTPRSLWLGIQLQRRLNNNDVAVVYGAILENFYRDSPEYQAYKQSIDD